MEKEKVLRDLKSVSELVGTRREVLLETLKDTSRYEEFISGLGDFLSFINISYFYRYDEMLRGIIDLHSNDQGKDLDTVNSEYVILLYLNNYSQFGKKYCEKTSMEFDSLESDRLGIQFSNVTLFDLYKNMYSTAKLVLDGDIEEAKKEDTFRGTVFYLSDKCPDLIAGSPKYGEIKKAIFDTKKGEFRCWDLIVKHKSKKMFAKLEKTEEYKQKKLGS